MILIDTLTTDPFLNLAAEEYFFRKSIEDITLLYINDPSLIIGKHQNPFEEINYRFVIERNIPVIRRMSGGGTVYHDHGNLNFTFIVNTEYGRQINFERFIKPVTEYLNRFGIRSELGDKHEVRTGGLKFSGNAAHLFKNRSLHHGTLLFSSRLDDLREALKKGDARFESRSVPSNRSSVVNLGEMMPGIGSTYNLKERLTSFLEEYFPGSGFYQVTNSEKEAFRKLAEEKYRKKEWTYGYGPPYVMHNEVVIGEEISVVTISVEKGIIVECRVTGSAEGEKLSKALTGKFHCWKEVDQSISEGGINIEEKEIFRLFG